MHLQQTDPLPDFYEARSKLILEESRKANQLFSTDIALVATAFAAATNVKDRQQEPSEQPAPPSDR